MHSALAMEFQPAADTISTRDIYSHSNMARTAAPAKKQAEATVEKIVPLTGFNWCCVYQSFGLGSG
jgi:hypothetical protein